MAKSSEKANKTEAKAGKTLSVTLTRSLLGRPEKHRRVAKALGLTKLNRTVAHADTPIIRGMINKISHLLTVNAEATA
ncbi:MAG: 50S ribosomal protein L30 [Vampirovibrionales bacterium]|nr:50S ribosomal protein L30 [Vampirovibrionales bacterium]